MANICEFEMKIKGQPEHIKTLVEIMDYKHMNTEYMARIGHVDVTSGDLGVDNTIMLVGSCAWSVTSCMLDTSPYTYYNQSKDRDKKITTIDRISKRLGLSIDIYANEPRVGFDEHITIINGEMAIYK